MIKQRSGIVNRIIYDQKFLAFCGVVVIILICFPLSKNINQRREVNKEIKNLNDEISGMENKNKDMKELISFLESDQFVEEQARLNLGLKKKGESVVVVKENKISLEDIAHINSEKNLTNPQRWIKYFLN